MARTLGNPIPRRLVLAAALIVTVGIAYSSAATAGEPSKRLQREVRIMEELVSDVLVESPYWLVSWNGPNHGTYIEDLGVIFCLEASLVSDRRWHDDDRGLRILSRLGKHMFFRDDKDDDWDDDWLDEDEDDDADRDDDAAEDDDAYRKLRSRRAQRSERCYERGKRELRETLTDGTEMLSELADDDWVILSVSLEDNRFFRRNHLSRLILKARMDDLRAHEAGRIDAEQLNERIIEMEY
ncbi:MAG: hypothetical protein KAY32_10635 [Candidatus Eisenbacteria sp.]|nr:hypothetical protein [Candidatus Eisenbacteria bacterium]